MYAYTVMGRPSNTTEHSPSEADCRSVSQEIPRLLWNVKFVTAFTSAEDCDSVKTNCLYVVYKIILTHTSCKTSTWKNEDMEG
jgi:hypothetical protein